MTNAGSALMGIGHARGDDRAAVAAEMAIASPLLTTGASALSLLAPSRNQECQRNPRRTQPLRSAPPRSIGRERACDAFELMSLSALPFWGLPRGRPPARSPEEVQKTVRRIRSE